VSALERLLEDPARVARLRRGFHVVLALIVVAEIATRLLRSPHYPIENIPAWGSLYGLLSCAAIIIVSKRIGKLFLMRREDYYGAEEEGPPDA